MKDTTESQQKENRLQEEDFPQKQDEIAEQQEAENTSNQEEWKEETANETNIEENELKEKAGIESEEIAFRKDESKSLFGTGKKLEELSFFERYRIKKSSKKQQIREEEYHYRAEKKLALEQQREKDKKRFFASSWCTILAILLLASAIVGAYPVGIKMLEGPDNQKLERYLRTGDFIEREFQELLSRKLRTRLSFYAVGQNQEQKDLMLQRMSYQNSTRGRMQYNDLVFDNIGEVNHDDIQRNNLSRYYITDSSNRMIQTNMTKEEIQSIEQEPNVLSVSFQINKNGALINRKIDSKYPNLVPIYEGEVDSLVERYLNETTEKSGVYDLVASMYDVDYISKYYDGESNTPQLDILRIYHQHGSQNNEFKLNGQAITIEEPKEWESDKKLVETINEVVKRLETLPREEISVKLYLPANMEQLLQQDDYSPYYNAIMEQRAITVMCLAAVGIFLVMLLAMIVPFRQQRHANIVSKFNHLPLELKLFLTFGVMGIVTGVFFFGIQISDRQTFDSKEMAFISNILSGTTPEYFEYAMLVAFLGLLFVYLYMTYLKYIYYCGIIEGLIKNSIVGRGICYLCRMVASPVKQVSSKLYRLQKIDLEGSFKKKVMGMWAFHAIFILFVIGLFGLRPEFAMIFLIAYVILVFRWMYRFLLQLAYIQNYSKKLSDGNFDLQADENIGIFSKTAQYLNHIKTGFKTALDEEVRSQNMKTELISNVSHDLKTPLTSIINYSDLLKQPNLTKEQQQEYIDTIHKKSQRLKVLIEDLFEASKASSGNITLQTEKLDIISVFRQTMGELEEKVQSSKLDFRMNLPKEPVYCKIDGQRTYRIFSNIISNITKYSLEHTRVYIDVVENAEDVSFEFKNISSYEMNFDASEIMERFKRGDESRNTEGSGLGLAIAKSLVELQGGTLHIEIDGDLFKLFVKFPKEK